MAHRVLLVEDHEETRTVVARALREADFSVTTATDLRTARGCLAKTGFAAAVVDWMLPDGSGTDLCREVRRRGGDPPVLMLTARGTVEDRVAGLEAGADDYLRKPFAVAELIARVRALVRRGPAEREPELALGALVVRSAQRAAFLDERELVLTPKEFEILVLLARARGRALSRGALLESIWGDLEGSHAATLEVLVSRLRRKLTLGDGVSMIRTHRGFGFSLRRDA